MAAHPHIDARVSASLALSNLKVDDVDVAIRFGSGNYPDCCVTKLFDDYMLPLCSPGFLAKIQPVSAADLHCETLIYDDTQMANNFKIASWKDWFKSMGVKNVANKSKGLHFNVADHAIAGAIAGAGMLLGRQVLAQNDIDNGRLVMPFEHKIKLDFSYYALCLKGRKEEKHIAAFMQWLEAEMRGDVDLTTPTPVA